MNHDDQMNILGERLNKLLEGFADEFDVSETEMAWLLTMQTEVILSSVVTEQEPDVFEDDDPGEAWKGEPD